MNPIVGPLACLAITVALAGCSGNNGSELRADFSSRFERPTTGVTSCPVIAVHFQDRTTGRPRAWKWTFGDGSTSSEQNPTWETNAVVAEVTLTASRRDSNRVTLTGQQRAST
jgi:PKD repeat protein